MTPLRQQMIDAMRQRGFSIRTHQSYLGAVRDLARYYHQSPDQLQVNQIQDYFVHLVQERGLSGASCRLYLNALRFLYLQVLHQSQFDIPIQYPKRAQKIPELLTRAEVRQIIDACPNDKCRTMLLLTWSATGMLPSREPGGRCHIGSHGISILQRSRSLHSFCVGLPAPMRRLSTRPPCSHTAAWVRSSSLIGGVSSSACGEVTSAGKNRVDLVEGHVSLLRPDDDQLVDGFVLLRTPQCGTAVCVRMDVSLRCYHHDRSQGRPGVPVRELPVGSE